MKFLYFTFKVKRMFAMSFLPAEKCSVIVGSLLVFVSFVVFFFQYVSIEWKFSIHGCQM